MTPPRGGLVALVNPRHSRAATQTRALVAWAHDAGRTLARTVAITPDAIGQLCEDVRQGLVEGAVALRLDVLGDLVDQEATRAVMLQAGGELLIATGADAAELAEPTEQVRELIRLYHERLTTLTGRVQSARLQGGFQRAQEAGVRTGGRTAYGKRVVAGQIVDDAREMAIVTRMEALADRGLGYSAIGRQMEAEGYTKRDGTSNWHPDTVKRILLRRRAQAASQPVDKNPDES